MKLNRLALMMTIALGALLACRPLARAQDKKEEKPQPKPEVKQGDKPTSRPDRAKIYAERLHLNDGQTEKIRPILDEEFKKIVELRQNQKLSREEKAVKYKEIREETNVKAKPIFTTEQFERFVKDRTPVTPKPAAPAPAPAPAAAPPPK